jgi:glycosyltransferase involved in cell wall biosynthesis
MRVVFVTQQVDPADSALAATVAKIRALADRVDELTVLALGALPDGIPPGVRVRVFGARTKAGRGLRYEAALAAELRQRPDVLIAHMCPIYAVLAAPLARPLGVRLVLWFTHWRATPTLRLAERLVDSVTSVDRRSFPLESRKLRAIGHGIDVREFPCRPEGGAERLRLLALGRYSEAKGLPYVLRGLRAALDLGVDAELLVHGPALTEAERAHRVELARLVDELGLGDQVRLEGPVPRSSVPSLFASADALVNNMRAGAPDKVVYEAAAGCLPVLASNPVFDELVAGLEPTLAFGRERPDELAARIAALAATDPRDRAWLGRALRERVSEYHSVGSWADGILAAAR